MSVCSARHITVIAIVAVFMHDVTSEMTRRSEQEIPASKALLLIIPHLMHIDIIVARRRWQHEMIYLYAGVDRVTAAISKSDGGGTKLLLLSYLGVLHGVTVGLWRREFYACLHTS